MHRIVFLRLSQIVLPLPIDPGLPSGASEANFDYSSLYKPSDNHHISPQSFFFLLRLNIFISFTCSLSDVLSRHVVLIIASQSFENTLLKTAHSIHVVV